MYDFPVTVDPRLVQAFFTEKRECYFPMNFSSFLGDSIASKNELADQVLSIDSGWVQATHEARVAPLVWLLAKDVRLAHIKRAVVVTDDACICFIRNARPGKCYIHAVSRKASPLREDTMVYLGSRH